MIVPDVEVYIVQLLVSVGWGNKAFWLGENGGENCPKPETFKGSNSMHSNGRRFCLQCYLRLWNWEKGNDNYCPGIKCPGDNCHPKKLLYGSAVINKILAIFRAVIIVSSLIGVTRRTTRRTPHQNLPDRIELMVWNLADRHILTRLRSKVSSSGRPGVWLEDPWQKKKNFI